MVYNKTFGALYFGVIEFIFFKTNIFTIMSTKSLNTRIMNNQSSQSEITAQQGWQKRSDGHHLTKGQGTQRVDVYNKGRIPKPFSLRLYKEEVISRTRT